MASLDIDAMKNGDLAVAVEEIVAPDPNEPASPGAQSDGGESVVDLATPPLPCPPEVETPAEEEPPAPSITPRVRTTDYEGFKNYYNEEEGCFAIEVLEAGADLKDQIMRERLRPGRSGGRRRNLLSVLRASQQPALGAGQQEAISNDAWIQRVRIKSRFILAGLREVTGQSWDIETPRTFYRPFSLFINYQSKMKAKLRTTWAGEEAPAEESKAEAEKPVGDGDALEYEPSDDGSSDSGSNAPADETNLQSVLKSSEAFEHLECWVNFVDQHIMPLTDLFKGTSRQKVRYSDLQYLFQPGDVVFVPTMTECSGSDKTRTAVNQPCFKICYTNPPSISPKNADEFNVDHKFYMHCYYIDYDGEKYGPVNYKFIIDPYEGDRDIKGLGVYPLRYFSDAKNLAKRLPHINQNLPTLLAQRHQYCRGWTLTANPNGSSLEKDVVHPEHIDSTVIIDFKAAIQSNPNWKTPFEKPGRRDENWLSGSDDNMPIIQWTDRLRTKQVRSTTESTQRRDPVCEKIANRYRKVDPFLIAFRDDKTGSGYVLGEDNTIILPSRVMAYVLRDRKFVQLHSHSISPIPKQANVFENLKIDAHHKDMVLALVDSHFHKLKNSQRRVLGQDLIQGKGEGLVILLHGVPGVGKTATAEAVAQFNDRPLFVITCGDLGFTPKEVETSLVNIFRLAHLWDCILLLDEADIFLAQRTRDDLKRNALVSVFLRVLEYYSGILFLTTNRVGTLDEAFKSRIHMSLYYPQLNREQTLQIFDMNIQRVEDIEREKIEERKKAEANRDPKADVKKTPLPDPPLTVDRKRIMTFASIHYDKHDRGPGRWNGRQIRNAFQIATSLAFYDMRRAWLEERKKNPDAKLNTPVLDEEQFIKVAKATLKFESYMNEARGGDDDDLARISHLRVDHRNTPDEQPSSSSRRREPESRMFGVPPQTPANRRRSTFQDDDYGQKSYDRNERNPYDRGNSYDEDPYDRGNSYGQAVQANSYSQGRGNSGYDSYKRDDSRERRTPTRSERSYRDRSFDAKGDAGEDGRRGQSQRRDDYGDTRTPDRRPYQ